MKIAKFFVLCSILMASSATITNAGNSENIFAIPCEDALMDFNQDTSIDLRIDDSSRLFSGAGTKHIFKLPIKATNIVVSEEMRDSRIQQDFKLLAAAFPGIGKVGPYAAVDKAPPKDVCIEYTQKYKRSKISFTIKDAQDKEILNKTLTAGPAEHWYLSADMPVTKVSQLVYDSESKTLKEKDKPSTFYFGLNYKVGDLFTEYKLDKFYNDFSVKVLFKASSHPNESMGIGLGYPVGPAELFVASLWTQNEDDVEGTTKGITQFFAAGVSFNISKGLDWLKSDKSEKSTVK